MSDKTRVLELRIEDCERRVGQYIISGGEAGDDYVTKQKNMVIQCYEELAKAIND